MPVNLVPSASDTQYCDGKDNFLPYFVCHRAGQTGVTGDKGQTGITGDKGQTGEKGITGDTGEFDKTSWALFQETVNSLPEQICTSSSVFVRTNTNSQLAATCTNFG